MRNLHELIWKKGIGSAITTTSTTTHVGPRYDSGTQVGIAVIKDVSSGFAGSATREAYPGYLHALANPIGHTCA